MTGRTRIAPTLALLVALTGCIGVPTSGPVEQVTPRGADTDFLVQIIPSGPEPAAGPDEIVRGWLTAMTAFPLSTDVAREFLTDEARQDWSPQRRTDVYTSAAVQPEDGGEVVLQTHRTASLTGRGSFLPAPAGRAEFTLSLELKQTPAGWRIANPPDTLLISAQFFEEYFRPFNLYFLDQSGDALVADPVWLPLGDQLTTQLVQGLLAGPAPWLRGQTTTTLSVPDEIGVSAPLRSDGVADVELSAGAANLSGDQRQLLSAQLVWTLTQVTGLVGLRLSVAGAPLDVPDVDPVLTTESWQAYDPSGPTTRAQLYAVRRGNVVSVEEDGVTPVSGWWGDNQADLGEVTVERTLERVAAVDRSRGALLSGPYVAPGRSSVRTVHVADGALHDPQWDRTGQLWMLDGSRLLVADEGRARRVRSGPLAAAGIRAFAVAPDGVRLAALVDRWPGPDSGEPPALVVARIVRAANGRTVRRLDHAYAVPVGESGLRDMSAPVWTAPSEVSVLGRLADVAPQVYRLAIDGSTVQGAALTGDPMLGPVGAVELTGAGVPGAQTVVGTRRGRLYAFDSQSEWTALGAAGSIRHPRHPD